MEGSAAPPKPALYLSPKKPVMPALSYSSSPLTNGGGAYYSYQQQQSSSSSATLQNTRLGSESISGPAGYQNGTDLGKLDAQLILRAFLAARLPAHLNTASNISYLLHICPYKILETLYEETGGAALLNALSKGSPEQAPSLVVGEIYGLLVHTFRTACCFYDHQELKDIYAWATDKLNNTMYVQKVLEKQAVNAMKVVSSVASAAAGAVGLRSNLLSSSQQLSSSSSYAASTSTEDGTLCQMQDPVYKSALILNNMESGDYAYFRQKCSHKKWIWQSLLAAEFVAGNYDAEFKGALSEMLTKTRLKISDIVILFGIPLGGTIPRRLWTLGYGIELHVLLPPEKCPATTIRTLFPRVEWSKDIVTQYRSIQSHVYDTIQQCYAEKERWLDLADLRDSLGASTAEHLITCMRYWSDFTKVSAMVNPPLTREMWMSEFGLTPQMLLRHRPFGFTEYQDGGIAELERRLKSGLYWTDKDFAAFFENAGDM